MSPQCRAFRAMLLDAGVPQAPASGHGASCASCADWARRAERLTRHVEALPRVAVPAGLEGRVVAALQAGHRQSRAVQAVAELGRVSSPAELDEFVDADLEEGLPGPGPASIQPREPGSRRLKAPTVLDRLVQEELAEPSRSRARRYLGSLRRRRAPEELRLRVALAIQRSCRLPPGRRLRPAGVGLGAGLAVAALLVVLGAFLARPAAPPRPRGPQIVVERVSDPSELAPFAAALLDGASGGLLSVEGL